MSAIRRSGRLPVAVVLLASLLLLAATTMAHAGAIGGTVTDARGQPVDVATVRAYTPIGTLKGTASTDADGRSRIEELPSGDYKVRFEPGPGDGAAQWYAAKGTMQSADAVTVVEGATTGVIDARLFVGAHIG